MDSLADEIQLILDEYITRDIPSRVEEALRRGYCRPINYDPPERYSASSSS
jgi:hypothetical protein